MKYHNTKEHREWRKIIINRDKKCVICKAVNNLTAHHINSASYFIELRHIESNGATLCKSCHSHFHNDYKHSYREKCDSKDWYNFKKLAKYLINKK